MEICYTIVLLTFSLLSPALIRGRRVSFLTVDPYRTPRFSRNLVAPEKKTRETIQILNKTKTERTQTIYYYKDMRILLILEFSRKALI